MNLQKKINEAYKKLGIKITALENDRSIVLNGECGDWQKIVDAGKLFVDKKAENTSLTI